MSPESTSIRTAVEVFHPPPVAAMGMPFDEWERLKELLSEHKMRVFPWIELVRDACAALMFYFLLESIKAEPGDRIVMIVVCVASLVCAGALQFASHTKEGARAKNIAFILSEMDRLRKRYSADKPRQEKSTTVQNIIGERDRISVVFPGYSTHVHTQSRMPSQPIPQDVIDEKLREAMKRSREPKSD